ncbi:MAG: hypothetical protein H7831_08135 [Magnetococcus sp. WYHC-3]
MAKLESAPNLEGPKLKSIKEDGLAPEKLETRGEQEKASEELKLSPEDQLENLKDRSVAGEKEMARLSESIETTKSALKTVREKLGLPSVEEDPPSVSNDKDKLDRLKNEQENLERQKEELVKQQERERLIREEREKIMQEKIDEIFKEFQRLNPQDLENILKSGKNSEGKNVESKSMGSLEPEVAQSLAKAFKEGIKLLPKILKALPDLLKKFEDDLTKEATERVDKKLEEEKKKMKEEQEKEEALKEFESNKKPEVLEGEIPFDNIKPNTKLAGGENIKTPEA